MEDLPLNGTYSLSTCDIKRLDDGFAVVDNESGYYIYVKGDLLNEEILKKNLIWTNEYEDLG